MNEQKFKVLISNGRMNWHPSDKDRYKLTLQNIEELYDGKAVITIDKYRPQITDAQRKLYWATLKEVSDITGYTSKEIHEILKEKFLKDFKEVDGKLVVYVKSITDLDTTEMTVYYEQAVIWLKEFFNIQGEIGIEHHE